MNKQIAYLGMDVHKNSITMALSVENKKDKKFIKKVANESAGLILQGQKSLQGLSMENITSPVLGEKV